MHKDCERVLITEEELRRRVEEVARAVSERYMGETPIVIGILKGSIIFFSDLIRHLDIPIQLDFMSVSSYGNGAASSGKLKIRKDIDSDVKGRDVILVEDIIDSGFTLANLKKLFEERGARSVCIVTLLNKKDRREYDVPPDFNCFDIENEFVVGYGLDYDERYRNLPYIGILKREIYET